MDKNLKLLVHNAKQIVCIVNNGERFLRGNAMKNIVVLEKQCNSDGYSIAVGKDGNIAAIGVDSEIRHQFSNARFDTVIDALGKTILPGLIDAHTHPIWIGDRVDEFALKLSGATYMEIHKAGKGIHYTVSETRKATPQELYLSLSHRLTQMLKAGTTLVEAKSGYALDLDGEIKLLDVLTRANKEHEMDLSVTYCGAHAVPKGMTAEKAVEDIVNHHIPKIEQLRSTGELTVDNIDVFCEEGVFTVDQTRSILQRGMVAGLAANFHGDELHPVGAAEMAGAISARCISHVECISDKGIESLAKSGTVATLLPTTAYVLHLQPPPVRKMITSGVIVALGTDFNPNVYCLSMPLTMNLACVLYGMSMEEAMAAATINASAALGRSATHGSLEVGKVGDMIILDAPRWEHLIYQMGGHDHAIEYVVKSGIVVHNRR